MCVVLGVGACRPASDHGHSPPATPEVGVPFDLAEHACDGQTPLSHGEYAYSAVTVPHRLEYVAPTYPQEAAGLGARGIVILRAVIDTNGIVRQTRVLRSIPMLDDAAADAVCRWRFTPARVGGAAIAMAITVTVEFPPTTQ